MTRSDKESRPARKRPRPLQARHGLAAWTYLLPQAALVSFGVAGLRFVEALVRPPLVETGSRIGAALLAGSLYWLSGLLLAALALLAWVVARALGQPSPYEPIEPPVEWTPEARLRGRGFNIVAAWVGLSFVAAIVMADTLTGPFAAFATAVLGLQGLVGVVTFLLALPALLSPLLLLALLPWQTRWPLVAAMQGTVKMPPLPMSAPARRRKRQ